MSARRGMEGIAVNVMDVGLAFLRLVVKERRCLLVRVHATFANAPDQLYHKEDSETEDTPNFVSWGQTELHPSPATWIQSKLHQ